MALIHCPECNREVSDQAKACPHCGYSLESVTSFHKKSFPLSKIQVDKKKRNSEIIAGICCIAFGIPLVPVIIGVFLICIGIWSFVQAAGISEGTQRGLCPYCQTELIVKSNQTAFRCPICNNFGIKTATALESTHDDPNLQSKE